MGRDVELRPGLHLHAWEEEALEQLGADMHALRLVQPGHCAWQRCLVHVTAGDVATQPLSVWTNVTVATVRGRGYLRSMTLVTRVAALQEEQNKRISK